MEDGHVKILSSVPVMYPDRFLLQVGRIELRKCF